MPEESARNLIWQHIRTIESCMMVTGTGDAMRARPMASIPRPEQNAIWFFTEIGSTKDQDVQDAPAACLTYSDLRSKVFVSVSGTITRVTDLDTIKDLWNPEATQFFPKGPADPDVVLLRFDPSYGEYWDCRSSTLATAIRFLASKVIGPHPNRGNSGTAQLDQTPGALA